MRGLGRREGGNDGKDDGEGGGWRPTHDEPHKGRGRVFSHTPRSPPRSVTHLSRHVTPFHHRARAAKRWLSEPSVHDWRSPTVSLLIHHDFLFLLTHLGHVTGR